MQAPPANGDSNDLPPVPGCGGILTGPTALVRISTLVNQSTTRPVIAAEEPLALSARPRSVWPSSACARKGTRRADGPTLIRGGCRGALAGQDRRHYGSGKWDRSGSRPRF